MTIFKRKTFIAYARPTRERVVLDVLGDRASAGLTVPAFAYSLANAQPAKVVEQIKKLPSHARPRLLLPDVDILPPNAKPKTPRHDYTASIETFASTATQATPWLKKVIDAEVDGGATVVVTPSLLLEPAHGDVELRRMLEWADAVRGFKKVGDRPVITALTLHRTWLSDDEKRETLLNVLTDADDPAFYFVVRWAAHSPSRMQEAEAKGLEGYREVIEVLRDADKEVVVGRSGLADYVLAGLGASAFLDGVSVSHLYRDAVYIRRAKGSNPPQRISHYLDGELLGLVPAVQVASFQGDAGPAACSCSYCLKLTASTFNDSLADRHQLALNANFADALDAAGNPRAHVRAAIAAAQQLAVKYKSVLPAYTTSHLGIWDTVTS